MAAADRIFGKVPKGRRLLGPKLDDDVDEAGCGNRADGGNGNRRSKAEKGLFATYELVARRLPLENGCVGGD